MKRCEGCGADVEQQQDHERGCHVAAGLEADAREPNSLDECRQRARLYGAKYASCPCGRKRVALYQRGTEGTGIGRGLFTRQKGDPYHLTYHNTPEGFTCTHGGALLADVDEAAEVAL